MQRDRGRNGKSLCRWVTSPASGILEHSYDGIHTECIFQPTRRGGRRGKQGGVGDSRSELLNVLRPRNRARAYNTIKIFPETSKINSAHSALRPRASPVRRRRRRPHRNHPRLSLHIINPPSIQIRPRLISSTRSSGSALCFSIHPLSLINLPPLATRSNECSRYSNTVEFLHFSTAADP